MPLIGIDPESVRKYIREVLAERDAFVNHTVGIRWIEVFAEEEIGIEANAKDQQVTGPSLVASYRAMAKRNRWKVEGLKLTGYRETFSDLRETLWDYFKPGGAGASDGIYMQIGHGSRNGGGFRMHICRRENCVLHSSEKHEASAESLSGRTSEKPGLHRDRSQPNVASPPELDAYKRLFYRYHLTQDAVGNPIWLYTILDFSKAEAVPAPSGPTLRTEAPIILRAGDDHQKHRYDWELQLHGNHLLLKSQRSDKTRDVAVELYAFPVTHKESFYGARVNDTWNSKPTVASSIVILSSKSFEGLEKIEQGPVPDDFGPILQEKWEQRSGIVRLPEFKKDSAGPTLYPTWEGETFLRRLRAVTRRGEGSEYEKMGDLRVVTTFFVNEPDTFSMFKELLRKGVRIKILVSNPKNTALMYARFGVREDRHKFPGVSDTIRQQISDLQGLLPSVKKEMKECRGTLEVRLSDLMPCAFVVHSKEMAVMGIMLATQSYVEGPMVIVESNTTTWQRLYDLDWRSRWDEAGANSTTEFAYEFDWKDRGAVAARRDTREEELEALISDRRLAEVEATLPARLGSKDVWVVSPNLSNATELTSSFSHDTRRAIKANVRRGIQYTFLFPEDHHGPGPVAIETLIDCCSEAPEKLALYPVPYKRFLDFTKVTCHFAIFNPNARHGVIVYMQRSAPGVRRDWLLLQPEATDNIVSEMRKLMKEFPARKWNQRTHRFNKPSQ